MKKAIFSDKFMFTDITKTKYGYTDNQKGSPMNYVAYMKKGRAKIVSPKITININEGEAFYIPKNLSYQSYWYGDPDIEFLSFGYTESEASDIIGYELQTIDCTEDIRQKLLNIPTEGSKVSCVGLGAFYSLMAELVNILKRCPETHEEELLNEITDCIRKHPFISISEVARMCKISESYLYSLFKKKSHATPNDYRLKVLCETGMELLVTTDKKIEEIAELTGFSSGSYFRKVLKKQFGLTPREIRKKIIGL